MRIQAAIETLEKGEPVKCTENGQIFKKEIKNKEKLVKSNTGHVMAWLAFKALYDVKNFTVER